MDLSSYPEMMRVADVAVVLSISRTVAYEQVKLFERTRGRHGIPVIRIGRAMRVPKQALLDWIDSRLGYFEGSADDAA